MGKIFREKVEKELTSNTMIGKRPEESACSILPSLKKQNSKTTPRKRSAKQFFWWILFVAGTLVESTKFDVFNKEGRFWFFINFLPWMHVPKRVEGRLREWW